MNQPAKVWPLLKHSPDPRVRSYLIHRLSPMGADAGAIIRRLDEEPDVTIRRALLLSLGEYGELSADARKTLLPKVQELYRTASDPGIHASAEWLLRTWKEDAWLKKVNDDWAADEEELQMKHDTSLQRETEPTIGLEGGAVGSDMSSAINSARGGGSTLADGVRTAAESTMGADFSGVRVHQDAQSDQLNRSMTAKAFTTGSDIFLRGDQNSSDTSLMAHELTHVVQQGSGAVSGGGGMTVGAADDAHEHEADAVAQQVVSGGAQRKQEESPTG